MTATTYRPTGDMMETNQKLMIDDKRKRIVGQSIAPIMQILVSRNVVMNDVDKQKLCLGPCEPFSGLCPGCGRHFSAEDTLFKKIEQGEDYLILRLLTEDGHPVCEDCGDRFAPDLMRELENSSARLFLWEWRPYDKNDPELGGILVRVLDHVYCIDDVPF